MKKILLVALALLLPLSASSICIFGVGNTCKPDTPVKQNIVNQTATQNASANSTVTTDIKQGSLTASSSFSSSYVSAETITIKNFKELIEANSQSTKQILEQSDKNFKEAMKSLLEHQKELQKQNQEWRDFTQKLVDSPPTVPVISGKTDFNVSLKNSNSTPAFYKQEETQNNQFISKLQDLTNAITNMAITSSGGSSVDTIQNLNATGNVTAWSSVVIIGVTPLTANTVITIPTAVANIGKTIKFIRADSTAFTVTLASQVGETITTLNAGAELNQANGAVTLEAITATTIRQESNIGSSATAVAYNGTTGTTITDNQSITSADPTFQDVAGSSFTLPVAGTYLVNYSVNGTASAGSAYLRTQITDSGNVLVPNSTLMIQAAGALRINGAMTFVITVASATTYKMRGAVGNGTATIRNTSATPDGVTTITFTQIGSSPVPMSLVGEYGEQNITNLAQTNASAANTFADVLTSDFTLPTAGIWEVQYYLPAGVSVTGRAEARLVTNTNVVVPLSNAISGSNATPANTAIPLMQTTFITTTGSAGFKLQWATSAAANNLFIPSGSLTTLPKITWIKISGFTPTSGTTVDYVKAIRTVDSAVLVANSTIIFNTSSSGNVPLNTTTGIFSLTAGKTYNMFASFRIDTGAVDYTWVDGVTGTPIFSSSLGTAQVAGVSDVPASIIYTPTTNQTVKLNVQGVGGTPVARGNYTYANITQIGATAITTNTPFYASVERHGAAIGTTLFTFAGGSIDTWDTIRANTFALQFTSANGSSNNASIGTNQITVNTTGLYTINADVKLNSVSGTNASWFQIIRNGTTVIGVGGMYNNAAGALQTGGTSVTVALTAGDIIDVRVGANALSNLNITGFSLGIIKLNNF